MFKKIYDLCPITTLNYFSPCNETKSSERQPSHGARRIRTDLRLDEKTLRIIQDSKQTSENIEKAISNGLQIILENGNPGTVLDLQNFSPQGLILIGTDECKDLLAVFTGLKNLDYSSTSLTFIELMPEIGQFRAWNIERKNLRSITFLAKYDTPAHVWIKTLIEKNRKLGTELDGIKNKIMNLALEANN